MLDPKLKEIINEIIEENNKLDWEIKEINKKKNINLNRLIKVLKEVDKGNKKKIMRETKKLVREHFKYDYRNMQSNEVIDNGGELILY
jgi:hypothetical protein